tara:strand:+ start:3171 stop:4259 length:1089 start_codon:yes stop_codon:yes gene_type:complete
MDLKDKLDELAGRVKRQLEHVETEEAVKTAFILPFLNALGYDVFNPAEVIPELTADHGVKKGEKVDYAVKLNDQIIMLIECKQPGALLEAKYAGQLFRYFAVTEARFGVLTDGIKYVFFSDLDKENKMDERPFFEFDLHDYSEDDVEELKKFSKPVFNLEDIISTASNLKYTRGLINEIRKEMTESPSEELVRVLCSRVYDGRFTAPVKDQFTNLVKKAFETFLMESINSKLKSAFAPERVELPLDQQAISSNDNASSNASGIDTTLEELEAHRIIQAIGADITDVERIAIRDAKSYCAILYDDNNRKPICRLYFNKKRLSIGIFNSNESEKEESRFDLEKVTDLYKHKALVLESLKQYLTN